MAAGGGPPAYPNRHSPLSNQLLLNTLEPPIRIWETIHMVQIRIMEAISTINLHRLPGAELSYRDWLHETLHNVRLLELHLVQMILVTQQSHPSLAISVAGCLGENNSFLMQDYSFTQMGFRVPHLKISIQRYLNDIEMTLDGIDREYQKQTWTVTPRSRVQRAPVFHPPILEHIISCLYGNGSANTASSCETALEFLNHRRQKLREKICQYQDALERDDDERHSASDARDLRHEVDKLEEDLQLVHNIHRMLTDLTRERESESRVDLDSAFVELPERQRDTLNDIMDESSSNLAIAQIHAEDVRKLKDEIKNIQKIINVTDVRSVTGLIGVSNRSSESEERKTWEDFERNTHEIPHVTSRASNRNQQDGFTSLRRESLSTDALPLICLASKNTCSMTPKNYGGGGGLNNVIRDAPGVPEPSFRAYRRRDCSVKRDAYTGHNRVLLDDSSLHCQGAPRRKTYWTLPPHIPRLYNERFKRNEQQQDTDEVGSRISPRLLLPNDLGSNRPYSIPAENGFIPAGEDDTWPTPISSGQRVNISLEETGAQKLDENYNHGMYYLGSTRQPMQRIYESTRALHGSTRGIRFRERDAAQTVNHSLNAQISDSVRELSRSVEQLLLVARRTEQVLMEQRNYMRYVNDGLNELRQDVSEIRDDVMLMRYVATITHRRESMTGDHSSAHPNRNMTEDSYRNIEVPEATRRNRRSDNFVGANGGANSMNITMLAPGQEIQNLDTIETEAVRTAVTRDEYLNPNNLMLNNQVPPGNRANNYWDNFKSYSRQNMLSNSKVNIPTQQGTSPRGSEDRSETVAVSTNDEMGNSASTSSRGESARANASASMKSFLSANFVENIGMKKRNKDQKIQPSHRQSGESPCRSSSSNSSPSQNEVQFSNNTNSETIETVGLVDLTASREFKYKTSQLPPIQTAFPFDSVGTNERVQNIPDTSGLSFTNASSSSPTSSLLDVDLMPVDLLTERQNSACVTPKREESEVTNPSFLPPHSDEIMREIEFLPVANDIGENSSNGPQMIFNVQPPFLSTNGVVSSSSPDLVYGIEPVNGEHRSVQAGRHVAGLVNGNRTGGLEWCRQTTDDELISQPALLPVNKPEGSGTDNHSSSATVTAATKKARKKESQHSGGGTSTSNGGPAEFSDK